MIELPQDFPPELYPVAFLNGHWRGRGELSYPGIARTDIVVDVTFAPGTGPFYEYRCDINTISDEATAPWSTESGFWRVAPQQPEGLAESLAPLEAMISDPAGRVCVYLGGADNGRATLVSDVIARTSSAAAVAASKRMYGLVKGQLMWLWELSAFDQPLQPYVSVAMEKVSQ
ncbi:FABP family protein [Rarobacter incanus]|uniref:Uncharacterized protein DUF1794 n=1 Tax=Rarobacter incanus TaxID=153494 RepID=A0A542SP83_9MICO|nr:FABP family protein [Rarobacter incanus]TQK76429.1 uncharacterized protein DUF1794 [Rarobacter incanus]